MSKRKLELLAPAKDLECGLAAIRHGADAVYIGADHFGARAAAGNSIDDIATLTAYAHQFGARVYVTVNTIIYEHELSATQALITDLSRIGVDALLVQDMATLQMRRVAFREVGRAPVLHASTQCDTRTAEKVRWLRDLGFTRAVLARELSVGEVKAIHEAVPDIELEVFVHGALCVSYSGVCYASQYCFQRSANRGACAQFCRMAFDLLDADGHQIVHDRYLLSMKDLCLIDYLEALADAGASSFKIEGRLKDADYVKNVVSAYSQRLDDIIAKRPNDYERASHGRVDYHFTPNLRKTFNRGFTTYFADGRQPDIASFDTPKALGEFVGHVKEVRRDSFTVAGTAAFANGDGLCFITGDHQLEGFRVNRAVGNRLYPYKMPRGLHQGMGLYRNNDEAFGKVLKGDTADRTLPVMMSYGLTSDGFSLTMAEYSSARQGAAQVVFAHQPALKPQRENITRQLSKLGGTLFTCLNVEIRDGADQYFIPSSLLSDLRRKATDALQKALDDAAHEVLADATQEDLAHAGNASDAYESKAGEATPPSEKLYTKEEPVVKTWQPEYQKYPYIYNISNSLARAFYAVHGLKDVQPAFEESGDRVGEPLIMQCRHCLRYTLGFCVRRGGQRPKWHEPLTLRLGDGRRFRLEFRCDECQMNIYAER